MEAATVVLPLVASLLTAVLVAMAQWVMLIPRIEERIAGMVALFDVRLKALQASLDNLEKQLSSHAAEERAAAHDCEGERKQIEAQLFAQANQNAKDIAVLKQARNHGYVTE